jgi:lysophospholipase L1-like esterase
MKYAVLWALLLTACNNNPEQTPAPMTSATPNQTIRYLALGDSYTIGTSVRLEDRWASQLAFLLSQQKITTKPLDFIAGSGWTAGDLLRTIRVQSPTPDYDLVSVLVGVNNQYRGQTTELYRQDFVETLKEAIRLAKGNPNRVFVLSIPDWGLTPEGAFLDRPRISREIDAFNAVAQEESKKLNLSFIDITPLTRLALADLSLVASDDLHYSSKMYAQWAQKALPIVDQLLKK